MISSLKGIIDEILLDSITIDVNGVGYFVYIPKRYLHLLELEQEVKIFTVLIHREDAMKLYGFETKEEREFFNLLISVSGIGAKGAISILSDLTLTDIVTSIYSNDTKKLSSVSGIGNKTAQRIILELKEKISKLKFEISGEINSTSNIDSEEIEETKLALLALGYSEKESNNVLNWLKENKPELNKSDDLIREALLWLSSNA